jgi:hypothetical protein
MKALLTFCCSIMAASFSLAQSPVISVNPESLSEGLYTGDTSLQVITVSNSGSALLTCTSIAEPVSPVTGDNRCVKFDGTNDNVGVPNDSSLMLTGQLTIEAWFNFEVGGGVYKPSLISKGRTVPNYEVFFDSTLQSRKIGLSLSPVGTIVSQSTLVAGTWYHVAFTYDGSAMKLYIDGVLDKSQAASGTISMSSYSLYFARRDNNTGHKYKGELDDVRLWNIARTLDEILQWKNHELTGEETGLVGYWKFNEESGNAVYDSSPYANNGSLNNGAARVSSGARITTWLGVEPVTMSIPAGSSSVLEVSYDAADMFGGTYDGRIVIHNNDPLQPQLIVPVQLVVTPVAQIELSTTELDFGEVFVGGENTLNFMISSTGSDTLDIYSMICPNSDFEISPDTLIIEPGGNSYVDVIFTPTAPASDDAVLTIFSNSMDTPEVTVALTGIGISPPVISVTPESLEADLYSGRSVIQNIIITNAGLNELEYNIVTSLPSWLTVYPTSGTCAPGVSENLDVTFNASYLDGGDYFYDLEISSNDPINPLDTVAVSFHITDAPCINSWEDTLFFGTLFVGYDVSRTLQVSITNTGSLDLLVTDVDATPSFFSATPGFAGIDPGEYEIFDVTFTPNALGNYSGELNFTSNDPLFPLYTIILKGSFSEPPEINVFPLSLSTDLYSGKTATKHVTITNTGASDLQYEITDYALWLDGYEDYVTVGNPSLYELDEFTLEAWIYKYGWNWMYPIITLGNNQGERFSFDCYYENVKYSQDWNGNYQEFYSCCAYHYQWIHVAITHDGNLVKSYINGNLVNYTQMSSPTNFSEDYLLLFGNQVGGSSVYYYGLIDDIHIWNYARTESEIEQDMGDGLIGNEYGLVGCWRFDEASGDYAHDASINGNNGTLHGNASHYSQETLPSWLTVTPPSGTCPPGASMDILVTFDASYLSAGTYNSNFVIASNDPADPSVTVLVSMDVTDAPSIVSDEGMLDYGELFIGEVETLNLVIQNTGSQDLLIFSAETYPDVYLVFPPYASLDPGETETFAVTFSPEIAGDYTGTLTFNCNDPIFEEYIVYLHGVALIPPVISVSPDDIYIELTTGQSAAVPFTLYNTGGSDLNFNITPGESGLNHALEFDGYDDYIDVGSNINLANKSFTLEAWAKEALSYNNHFIFGNGNSYNYNYSLHVGFRYYDVFTFDFYGNTLNTPVNYNDNDWHHWACTFDDATNARIIYRDGSIVASDISYSNYFGTGAFFIGQSPWYDSRFEGSIDEVRIWDKLRTQEEINESMNIELVGSEQGLVGYWNFDEGTDFVVYDKSQFDNNGTIVNGATWTEFTAPLSPAWLTVSVESGKIAVNESLAIDALFNTTGLEPGDYYANIVIASNDPITPLVVIPVHLVVNTAVGIEDPSDQSSKFKVQSYPNPFSEFTTLSYELDEPGIVTLSVYNHLGQQVDMLINEQQDRGGHRVQWNAEGLKQGVYFFRITAGNISCNGKLVLVR